jgi:hypothetical protein
VVQNNKLGSQLNLRIIKNKAKAVTFKRGKRLHQEINLIKQLAMKGKFITTQIILACLSSGKKQVKLAA